MQGFNNGSNENSSLFLVLFIDCREKINFAISCEHAARCLRCGKTSKGARGGLLD
jgi:hypothetical protein